MFATFPNVTFAEPVAFKLPLTVNSAAELITALLLNVAVPVTLRLVVKVVPDTDIVCEFRVFATAKLFDVVLPDTASVVNVPTLVMFGCAFV
jgi:hypothetical protein